ncbi:ComEC/Rec2 family competence protein [Thermopolyspora sp. NPDC052614]|uniref:ComEC/Rec2 family competence protein n=1 Tax=Thermopolyspora sp. NPDC052614 TaxID=3155682 RepID=UPI0034297E57
MRTMVDQTPRRTHSLILVAPALAAWATAFTLLGHPAPIAWTVAALATSSAIVLALAPTRESVAARAARLIRSSRKGRDRPADRTRRGETSGWRRAGIGVLGSVAAVGAGIGWWTHLVSSGPVAELARERAVAMAEVVLSGDPRVISARKGVVRRESVVVEGRAEVIDVEGRRTSVWAPVVLLASGREWTGLLPSQRVRVRGRLSPADPAELRVAVMLVRGPPQVLSGPSLVQRVAGRLRQGLRDAADALPQDQRGLLPALVVGDLSRMDERVRGDLNAAGLGHLTAVSGTNLMIVGGAALVLARAVGAPLAARAVVVAGAMVAFAIVARPSPSVLRALFMGVVGAIALGTGRARDGVAALSATVLVLILFDPELSRSYGFALSVAATAGILVLAPRWRDRLAARLPPRVPRWVAEAVAVPAAAQAGVTPVLVLISGQIEAVAVPANLIAGPAVAPATVLGFVTALVAPVSMDAAQWIARPAGLAVGWIILVAERAAALPLAVLPWPGGPLGLLLLGLSATVGHLLLRRVGTRRVVLALAAGVTIAFVAVTPVVAPWPPPGWLLVACDVGQGDALVVSAGDDRAVVVDTGPDPTLIDACLRDLGVRRVPLLILTHPHLDHVGGLEGVFRHRTVGAALVSPGRRPAPETARLSLELRRRRTPEWVAPPGTRWRFGPAELTVLAPDPRPGAPPIPDGAGEGSAVNNASVVIHLRWPSGSALLSGDIESEAQTALLRQGVPPVDILKVPHHGSARGDPTFLAAARPSAALISVGADNDYGHPAPQTLARLAALSVRVYRTDRQGDLAVVTEGGRLAVSPRGNTRSGLSRDRPAP